MFPFLNQKLDFSNEKAEHVVIHDGLDKITACIEAGKETPSAFDDKALKDLMTELKDSLVRLSPFPPSLSLTQSQPLTVQPSRRRSRAHFRGESECLHQ